MGTAKEPWAENEFIHNRGMGPELRGTRIVMTDIYPYMTKWTREKIAEWYRLTLPQVDAAMAYIEQNRERVEADIQVLRERAARGNPPEIEEMRKGSRARLLSLKKALEERNAREAAEARATR